MRSKQTIQSWGAEDRPVFGGSAKAAAGLWRSWSQALERRRQRRELALLDAHELKDIGLTHDDVRAELRKPFWQ